MQYRHGTYGKVLNASNPYLPHMGDALASNYLHDGPALDVYRLTQVIAMSGAAIIVAHQETRARCRESVMETSQPYSSEGPNSDYRDTLQLRPDDHDYIKTLHLRPDGTIDCGYYIKPCRRIAESEALQRKWQRPKARRMSDTSGWRRTGIATVVFVVATATLLV